jgi:dienelactone hydrolase
VPGLALSGVEVAGVEFLRYKVYRRTLKMRRKAKTKIPAKGERYLVWSVGQGLRAGKSALVSSRVWLLLLVPLLLVSAAWAQEISMVPVTVDGETVRLAMRIYRPATAAPVPTLVYNHGSTGRGRDPSLFVRPIDQPVLAQFFVRRGWAVVMPARRGRGGSEGLYDEGFDVDRTRGYTCDPPRSLAGAERALRDIEAAMDAILAMPFVDRDRIVIGGVSRGGILSVAYAGLRPEQVKGVINFVGGWLGTGCPTAGTVNRELFTRGARYPGDTIWLYGDEDPFYPLSHSRANFGVFQAFGGKGTFHEFAPPPGASGHGIAAYPNLWASLVEAYLKTSGSADRRAVKSRGVVYAWADLRPAGPLPADREAPSTVPRRRRVDPTAHRGSRPDSGRGACRQSGEEPERCTRRGPRR